MEHKDEYKCQECGGQTADDEDTETSPYYKWQKCLSCGAKIKIYNLYDSFIEY